MQAVMDHIVLNAEDIEALVHFYTAIVELEPERLAEFRGGKAPFPSVRLNADTVIDLAPKMMWESNQPRTLGRPNLNHFCLTLEKEDWEKLRDRLTAHKLPWMDLTRVGARMVMGPRTTSMIQKGTRSRRDIMESKTLDVSPQTRKSHGFSFF